MRYLQAWIAISAMLVVARIPVTAQERQISPTRGFQPAHSYGIDRIESIDKGTGSLGLHIPITQLPPGRAGFTAGVTLSYSNRYWNGEAVSVSAPEYDLHYDEKSSGGWRLSMTPTLDSQIVPSLSLDDPCQSGIPNDMRRLSIVEQDGSRHMLYRSTPAEAVPLAACFGSYRASEMNNTQSKWYTADGSYLRLVIEGPSNPPVVDVPWPENVKWTLYRQDGSTVSYDPTITPRKTYLRDRNGNTIAITTGTQDGVKYELMTDDFGRTLRVDHHTDSPVRSEVKQFGHAGGDLKWVVFWTAFPQITQPASFKSSESRQLDFSSGPQLVSSLQLPNNLTYTFSYGSRYKELSQMTMPTGATVQYTYRLHSESTPQLYHQILANTVASKTITHDSVTETWQYAYNVGPTGTYTTASVTAPDGGVTTYEFYPVSYQFSGLPAGGTLTRILHPDGTETRREWKENRPAQLPAFASGLANQWVEKEWSTIANSPSLPVATSLEIFYIDKNGNPTMKEERDWLAFATPPATTNAVLRKTVSTFSNQAGDAASVAVDDKAYSHPAVTSTIRNLMASQEVQTSGGTVVSRRQFSYSANGNLEHEYHWDSTKAGSLATGTALNATNAIHRGFTYTANGNIQTETDARNNSTTYSYAAVGPENGCGNDLYPTSVSRGGIGSVAQTTTYRYNLSFTNNGCNSGLRTETVDPNSVKTTVEHDAYGRPTTITEGSSRKTTHEYNDASRWIATRNDAETFADQNSVSVLLFDQLGRIKQSRQMEAAVTNSVAAEPNSNLGIHVDTGYVFSAGRNDVLVSNPYRPASEGAASTRGWTVTRRDKVGRVCMEERFGGAGEPAVNTNCLPSAGSIGGTSRTYQAQFASGIGYRGETVTDAAGSARTLYSDALGRLIGVVEDPAGLRYATYYGYDLNDNLTSVRQAGKCVNADPMAAPCAGGLVRSFWYSSLNRLSMASNPETGSVQYGYDDAGNLIRRQQGSVVRCSGTSAVNGNCSGAGYDDLNRPVAVSYSDGTPAVTYAYDTENAANRPGGCATGKPIGRLSSVSTSISGSYYYHSELGYPQCSRQATNGANYDFRYTMSPQGTVRTTTYPSGRVVTSSLDHAGRVTAIGSGTKSYAAGIQYASHGAVSAQTLGSGLMESWTYNGRLQATKLQAGTLLGLDLYYCPNGGASCPSNNGNVAQQKITRGASVWTQSYTYDTVNRLSTAGESGAGFWSQAYRYDAFGNRWVCQHSGTGLPGLTLETPVGDCGAETSGWFTGNRISGWGYDGAGNVTGVSNMARAFQYDGENRQVAATINLQTSTYAYDGEGRRVKSVVGGVTTVFVYDAAGQLAGEYGPNAETGTQYVTVDGLGSTRLITTGSGSPATPVVYKNADYLPYGEELKAGMGGGARGASFDGLGNDVKFTGKERDAETGLDYFGARYMSAAQGRFTSPDEFAGGPMEAFGGRAMSPGPLPYADITNPQSLNKYTYGYNNPLRYIDPDGHEGEDANDPNKPRPQPIPAPRLPDGRLAPPPVPLPPGKTGKPNEWVPVPNENPAPGQRPERWKPRDPIPHPKGSQPSGSWDPEGHWDIDIPKPTGGKPDRQRFLPDGTPVGPDHQPIPSPGSPRIVIDPQTVRNGATTVTTGVILYWIISEGSRLFPPRNLIPIP